MGKMLGVIGNKSQFIRILEKVNVALQDMSIAMGPSTSDFVHCLNFGGGIRVVISSGGIFRNRIASDDVFSRQFTWGNILRVYRNLLEHIYNIGLTVDCVRQFIFIITHIC